MVEMFTLNLELYQQEPRLFAQQLGQALEEKKRPVQISGVDQNLVDTIYRNALSVFERYQREFSGAFEFSKQKRLNRRTLELGQASKELKDCHLLRCWDYFPEFKLLAHELSVNLGTIGKIVVNSLETYLGENLLPSRQHDLQLFQYKGTTVTPACFNDPELILGEHTDSGLISLAPTATQEGLEGKFVVNDKKMLVKLRPDLGHAIVLPGTTLNEVSKGRIKSLNHQLRRVGPRLSLIYTVLRSVYYSENPTNS